MHGKHMYHMYTTCTWVHITIQYIKTYIAINLHRQDYTQDLRSITHIVNCYIYA